MNKKQWKKEAKTMEKMLKAEFAFSDKLHVDLKDAEQRLHNMTQVYQNNQIFVNDMARAFGVDPANVDLENLTNVVNQHLNEYCASEKTASVEVQREPSERKQCSCAEKLLEKEEAELLAKYAHDLVYNPTSAPVSWEEAQRRREQAAKVQEAITYQIPNESAFSSDFNEALGIGPEDLAPEPEQFTLSCGNEDTSSEWEDAEPISPGFVYEDQQGQKWEHLDHFYGDDYELSLIAEQKEKRAQELRELKEAAKYAEEFASSHDTDLETLFKKSVPEGIVAYCNNDYGQPVRWMTRDYNLYLVREEAEKHAQELRELKEAEDEIL